MKLEFYPSDTVLDLLQSYVRRNQNSKYNINPKILPDLAKTLGGKEYNDFAQVQKEVCRQIRQSNEKPLEKISHKLALFLINQTAELTPEKYESTDPESKFKELLDSVKIETWKTPTRCWDTYYLDEAIQKLKEFSEQNSHFKDKNEYKKTIQEAYNEVDHCDLERFLSYISLGGSNLSSGHKSAEEFVNRLEKSVANLKKMIEQRPHLKNNRTYKKQMSRETQKHNELQKDPPLIDKELLNRLKNIAEQISEMAS